MLREMKSAVVVFIGLGDLAKLQKGSGLLTKTSDE